MIVFLIGYMGCGKSTVGRKLASKVGFEFIDMDSAIEREQGKSVSEIFADYGETAFREMEANWLKKQQSDGNKIIATGGGVPCYGENMTLLNSLGVVVYLKLDANNFACRISQRGREKRPLLRGMNDEQLTQFVKEKLCEREPYYSQARITVDCNGRSDEYITSHIETIIKNTL